MSLLSNITGINVDTNNKKVSATPGAVVGGMFGGIAGSAAGNVVSDAMKPADAFNPSALDSGTQSMIDQKNTDASMSAKDMTARAMTGVAPASGALLSNSSQLSADAASRGGFGFGDSMSSAIQNQANKQYDKSLGSVSRMADFQGQQEKMNKVTEAANLNVSQMNLKRGLDTRIAAYQTQADATRYAVISGIMGGAGSAAGAYFGGQMKAGGTGGAAPSWVSSPGSSMEGAGSQSPAEAPHW